MGKITFILGGVRSGKSWYGVQLAKQSGQQVAFIATCPYYDAEMQERIKKHKAERPSEWGCFEEFTDIASVIKDLDQYGFVLIDCLTLFVSNLVLDGHEEPEILSRVQNMLNEIKKSKLNAALVANEVGLGVVPESPLGRKFRDIAGRVNQIVAHEADEVYFTVAGIPRRIK